MLPTNNAVFINEKNGPSAGPTFRVINPEVLGYLTLGIEVCQDWVWDAAKGATESLLSGGTINAYAQNLGISLFEPTVLQPERGDLVCSATGERENVEMENYVFLSYELTKADFLPVVVTQREIWSRVSNINHFNLLPSNLNSTLRRELSHCDGDQRSTG